MLATTPRGPLAAGRVALGPLATAPLASGSLAVGATLLSACSPRFDWREARLPGGEIRMLLPARPATLTRRIHLREEAVEMTMIGAEADGLAFTVAIADAGATRPVEQRLADMQDQMLRNIGAPATGDASSAAPSEPARPPLPGAQSSGAQSSGAQSSSGGSPSSGGAPPSAARPPRPGVTVAVIDDSGRETGRRPAQALDRRGSGEHEAVRMQARFFIADGRAAQAVVIGRAFDDDAARQFFESLRIVEP